MSTMITSVGVNFTTTTYDATTETYQFDFDPDESTPSMAVVAALSEVTETDPELLEPLQEMVDTDALDAMLRHGDTEAPVSITFTASGYTITVHTRGVVELTSPIGDQTGITRGAGR